MGLSWTSFIQILLSLVPVALFFGFAVAAVTGWHMTPADIVHRPGSGWDTAGIAVACCAVFFTYSGWNVLTYVGGEIRTPARTIPRVILAGVVLTTAIYVVLNLAFLTVSPLDALRAQANAGVALASAQMGPLGAQAFSILLAMALLAGINATMMAGSRVAYAMAEDGLLWRRIRRLDPRHRTPATAIVLQGVLASLLVLTGSFSFLVTWTGSLMILLSCVTISTIFVFRWRRGMRPPAALAGYPWTALVFLATGLAVWVLGLAQDWKLFLTASLLFVALSVAPVKGTPASPATTSGTHKSGKAGN
jgi:APA family basic amino acid/polyamine antiporter